MFVKPRKQLGVVRGKVGLNPSSIYDSDGNSLLDQQLLTKQAPTISGVITDESKNAGDARPVQLGRAYLFDGTDDRVDTGLNLNDFCADTFSVDAWIDPTDGQSTTGCVFGSSDNLTFGTQGAGSTNGLGCYVLNTGKLAILYKAGGNYARADTASAVFVAGAQPAPRKFRFTLTAGVGMTILEFINGAWVNITLGAIALENGLFSTNSVVMSSFSYDNVAAIGTKLTGTSGAAFFGGKVFGLEVKSSTGALYLFNKCDEQAGTVAYDSSGNGKHGTITNATLSTFHSTQNVYSYQNEVGYSDGAGGVKIPRNEALPLKDGLGNDLQYKGRVPHTAQAKGGNCILFNLASKYANTGIPNSPSGGLEATFIIDAVPAGDVLIFIGARDTSVQRAYLSWTPATLELSGGIGTNVNTVIKGGLITLGKKHTGKITWDGTTVKLFFDGVEVYSGAQAGTVGTVQPFFIGTMNDLGTTTTTSANAKILNAKILDGSGNILGEYDLATGAGTIAYDKSGNNNHATLINAPTVTTQDAYHPNLVNGFSRRMVFAGAQRVLAAPPIPLVPTNGEWRVKAKCYVTTLNVNGVVCSSGASMARIITLASGNVWSAAGFNTGVVVTTGYHEVEAFTSNGGGTTHFILDGGTPITGTSSTVVGQANNFEIGTRQAGLNFNGLIWDVYLNYNSNTTDWKHHWLGTGNALADWTDQIGTANATIVGGFPALARIPAKNATTDALNSPLTHPAGIYHNDAESTIDFTNSVASPQAVINAWETAWAFDTARVNPEFKRTLTLATVPYRADRFLAYKLALAGTNLSKVQKYTLTRAI